MEEETQPSIFDGIYDADVVRRKDMIPKWIRVFAWIFAVLLPLSIVGSFISIIWKGEYNNSIYGFYPSSLISLAGMISLVSYLIKGTAAIGLLAEKNWAVKMAIADGILGIALCIFSLIVNPWTSYTNNGSFTSTHYNFRFELLFLIPYLVKMINIRKAWEENKYALPHATQD